MVDKKELKQLRKEIAIERSKISKAKERRMLESELTELRRGQKKSVRIAREVGRAFKSGATKLGTAALKQARLIAREQERQRMAARRTIKKGKRVGKKIVRIKTKPRQVFVPGLGVVTTQAKTIKKVRRKPKKRRMRQPREDDGFFGGLDQLGI